MVNSPELNRVINQKSPKRKDIVMIKKGSVLLLVLLICLPGCRKERKEDRGYGKRGRNMAQKTDDFNTPNLALADKDLDVDETTKALFNNEMNEFMSFVEGGDFDLEDAMKKDEFAWQAAGDQRQLETVYFGFNQNKVGNEQRAKLDHNADKAKQLLADAGTDAKLVVEGHACASAGSDVYNMALSLQRATEVSNQLAAAGVSRNQLKTVGRGNEMLVVKEGGREEQAPNRRVEMHVIHS